jgi:L-cysteine desulfidase
MVISKKKFLLSILKDVITPAYGCTEIGCVALCASIVAEHLKSKITKAEIYISPFIYRNDVNVGVPNLGQCGIVTIAAAGFVVKQSKKGLAVLSNISKSQIADARKLANAKVIKVMIQKHGDPVYCRVIAHDKFNNVCEVLIEHKHDLIKYIKLNNKTIFSKCVSKTKTNKSRYDVNEISLIDLFKVVNSFTLKEISFLKTGLIMNEKIMKKGFAQSDSLIKIATIVSNNIDSVK